MQDTCERSCALAEELGEFGILASGKMRSAMGKMVCEGATPEVIRLVEEAVHLAETLNEPRLSAETTVLLGHVRERECAFELSHRTLQQGLKLAS